LKENFYNLKAVSEIIGTDSQKLAGKTILWTGTSGFLGQWVIRVIKYLNEFVLEVPCKMLAYDMLIPDQTQLDKFADCGIHFYSHNLIAKLPVPKEKIDYVVHMAGIASPTHYKVKPLETIDVALEGVRSTLEISKINNAKFLFTSSSEVYQTATVIPTPESYIGAIASNNERSCYDISKLMAENYVYIYSKNYNVDACSVRIFNSFGPGISEQDSRILPRIASSVKSGKIISIYKTKELPKRTYCPTANTVGGIFKALLNGKKTEVYNIGISKPEISVDQLIDIINKTLKLNIKYKFVESISVYSGEPLRRCPDITKAVNEIGYFPKVTLEEGIKDFFGWAEQTYKGIEH
jgi:UDP-glucuronate decarboxylase